MDECARLTLGQPFERLGGPRFVARLSISAEI
jgi:hypothetical protein